MPWVRVFRHEYQESDRFYERDRLYGVDVVHKDFFEKYLDEHVTPFADEFGRRALKHHELLASGKGFASGLGKSEPSQDIESLVRIRSASTKIVQGREIAKRITRFLARRGEK